MQWYDNKRSPHLGVTGLSHWQLLSDLLHQGWMCRWVRIQIVDKKRWKSNETNLALIYHSKHQTLLFSDHPQAKFVLFGLIKAVKELLHCSTLQSFYLTINRRKKHIAFKGTGNCLAENWDIFSLTNYERDWCTSLSHSLLGLMVENCTRYRNLLCLLLASGWASRITNYGYC